VLPCSSKTEVSHLFRILEHGTADGIEIVGCDRNQCRYLTGKNITEKRIEYARKLLDRIGMGSERLGMTRTDGLSAEELVEIAGKRAKALSSLGPNPMKKRNKNDNS
jgi:coenzyme F420-reducing hydrogenase delta subunit